MATFKRASRVRTAPVDAEKNLPWKKRQEWTKKADTNYDKVDETYQSIAFHCLRTFKAIPRMTKKTERKHAITYFMHLFPKLRDLHAIGFNDLVDDVDMSKMECAYYRHHTRK